MKKYLRFDLQKSNLNRTFALPLKKRGFKHEKGGLAHRTGAPSDWRSIGLAHQLVRALGESSHRWHARGHRFEFELQGGLAQLARALAWHARGHRFESDILHQQKKLIIS